MPPFIRQCLLAVLVAASVPVSATPAALPNSDWCVRVWEADGLPEKSITGLAQTPDGYLWVATAAGLARFDGSRFEPFAFKDLAAQPGGKVGAMLLDRAGRMWIAMNYGPVVCLDSTAVRIFSDPPANDWVQSMVEDGEGALWIDYRKNTVCRIKDGRVTLFTVRDGLPEPGARCELASDRQGRVWFAKGNQVGVFRNGRFETLARMPGYSLCMTAARTGGVWIVAHLELFRCDEEGHLENRGSLAPKLSGPESSVMLEDRSGAVWIGTSYSGLFRYDGAGFESIPTSHHKITALIEDRQDNLWVGTGGGGVNQVQPRAISTEGAETGLPSQSVQSICEDGRGQIWGITQNGLLISRIKGGWNTVEVPAQQASAAASCIALDSAGAVWLGTRSHLLFCLRDGHFTTWDEKAGLAAHTIRTLLAGKSGDIWIAGEVPASLQCLRAGQFLPRFKLPPNVSHLRALAEDLGGNIWVGAGNGSLLRISHDVLTDETPALSATLQKQILCLQVTPDDRLWIGYDGGGLGCLKNGRFASIRSGQGLYNDNISQIIDDGRGWLWFRSDKGLFKVRQQELEDVAEGRATRVQSVHYGESQGGLPSVQISFGNSGGDAMRSRDGHLWIPMGTALAVVNPDKLHEEQNPPPVLLTRVAANGQLWAQYGGVMPVSLAMDLKTLSNGLSLPPEAREVEFGFTALDFNSPENVHFRYRLEGIDDDWIETSTSRSASYSRLAAGSYLFQVKACNGAGIWNDTGATLVFTIAPFFWETWWFRIAALTGLIAAIATIARYVSYRRLRLKVRVLQQQATLEKERSRIARDIHDDVGNRLTKIMLLSKLALLDYSDPAKAGEHVQQIAAAARQVTDTLDEIVWAVNPRNDTLPHLIDYIGQFAVDFLRAADIRCHLDLPDHPTARLVPAEIRHNLFLIVKEALTNVVRHASSSEVRLRIMIINEELRVGIDDNGRGFEPTPDRADADGLRNMHLRADEIGGRFEIHSQLGTGTQILIVLPWPHRERPV